MVFGFWFCWLFVSIIMILCFFEWVFLLVVNSWVDVSFKVLFKCVWFLVWGIWFMVCLNFFWLVLFWKFIFIWVLLLYDIKLSWWFVKMGLNEEVRILMKFFCFWKFLLLMFFDVLMMKVRLVFLEYFMIKSREREIK